MNRLRLFFFGLSVAFTMLSSGFGQSSITNHAPVGTSNTVTLAEDTSYAFSVADFGFTDPNDSPPNQFMAVKITTLPGAGTLSSGGSAVTNGQWIGLRAGANWTARETNRQWQAVASSADGTKLVAADQNGHLYTSTDSGTNWTARGEDSQYWLSVASSADGTKLVAVGPGPIYTSTDSGTNWTMLGNYNQWWQSVASSADGTKLVAAASTAVPENNARLYTSTDSGTNWTARETNRVWFAVASSSDGTKLVAGANVGYLYTSTDSGTNWTERAINRSWYSVASSADGTKLVAAAREGQLYTSTDSGTNWTARETNRAWLSVASSSDGTKLVAGVYGGQLYTSTDSGETWTPHESSRNWHSVASSADGMKLVAGVYGGQLYTSQGGLDLTFTPEPNGYGSPYGHFTFQVQDDGGTANGGADLDPTPKTMTLDVTAAAHNHAPVGTSNTVTMLEDTPYAFSAEDFGFTDPNDSPPNAFAAVKITTLPAFGTLTSGGSAVTNGQWISITAAGENWTARETNRNWRAVASSSDGTKLVAAVQDGHLYTSTDSGATWTARATNGNWQSVASSSDGTKLVVADDGGWLYTSTDSGTNWTARETNRNWRAVASSADGTKLVAGELDGPLYTSTDSGATWTARISGFWRSIASSADGTKLVAATIMGPLYTSTDSGATWTARISRNWSSVASSSDGTKLVATVSGERLYTSTDSGVTWTGRDDVHYWKAVASSSDGTKLVAGADLDTLFTSTDSGVSWTRRDDNRSWWAVASSSDGTKLVAAVENGQLYTSQSEIDLTFTPDPDGYGSPYSRFTFQVQDDGGTADGGADLDPNPKTMTLDVTSVPDDQTITFPGIADQAIQNVYGLSATAWSGLDVSFAWGSGPASIADGTNISFMATGLVSVVASQGGNADWNVAPNVTNTFRVYDDVPPVIVGCPSTIDTTNIPGDCSAVVSWTAPTATDNWAVASFTSNYDPGDSFPVGTSTVAYVAVDQAMNTATCSFSVVVADVEDPTITCPADIAVNTDYGTNTAVVTFSDPVYDDNCPGAALAQTGGLASGSAFPTGVTVNAFAVTDAAGNTSECSFNVTVKPRFPLTLVATNGMIVDATNGLYPPTCIFDLMGAGANGYVFDSWSLDGADAGSAPVLTVTSDSPHVVTGYFAAAAWDMNATGTATLVSYRPTPNYLLYLAVFDVCNPADSGEIYRNKYVLSIKSSLKGRLRYPDGVTPYGDDYADVTAKVMGKLAGIGNGDAFLDPGECVRLDDIELIIVKPLTVMPPSIVVRFYSKSLPDTSNLDTDRDGIPNGWEDGMGLNRNDPVDAALDQDADGVPSGDEYTADTHPYDPTSYLRVHRINPYMNGQEVIWIGGTSVLQYLECSGPVPGEWVPIATNLPPTPTTNLFNDAILNTHQLYRVRAVRNK